MTDPIAEGASDTLLDATELGPPNAEPGGDAPPSAVGRGLVVAIVLVVLGLVIMTWAARSSSAAE